MTFNPTHRHLQTLLLALCLAWFSTPTQSKEINQPAPNFTLKSIAGSNLKLSEYRGQVILLNFWASWCGPCRQEMPILESLHNRYKDLGFTVLGVNVEKDPSKAQEYLKEVSVTFPILLDTQNSTSELYNVEAMPTTVIIDRDGNMRYLHKGYKSGFEDKYEQEIKVLIRS